MAALIPLADLAELAALLGIRPWHRDNDADLAVLRELLPRRTALAQGCTDRPTGRPGTVLGAR